MTNTAERLIPRQHPDAPTSPAIPGSPFEQAATAPTMAASPIAVLIAFALVAAGGGAAWLLRGAAPLRVSSPMAAYMALLVMATAIERLLEPFTTWLPGRKARDNYDVAVAGMMNGHVTSSLKLVAAMKARVDRSIANRAVVIWGLATAIATSVCGASGFYVLHTIAAAGYSPNVPPWVDALATGLIVGSGTKPLHDLISKAQDSKSSKSAAE